MQKSIWIFGLLAGVLSAFVEYLFFTSENASVPGLFITKIGILAVCIVLGLILARKLAGGTISIARTILSGISISIIRAAVLILVFTYLYSPNGEFYESKLNQSYDIACHKIEADTTIKSADKPMKLDEAKNQIASQYKPAGYSMITIGGSVIAGLILSILVAAFISTNMMYSNK